MSDDQNQQPVSPEELIKENPSSPVVNPVLPSTLPPHLDDSDPLQQPVPTAELEEVFTDVWKCEIDLEIDGLPKGSFDKEKIDEKSNGEGVSSVNATAMEKKLSPVPLDVLTVGRKFLLRCQGDPVFLKKENVKLVVKTKVLEQPTSEAKSEETKKDKEQNDNFSLRLLRVDRLDEKSIDLVVTSYSVGAKKLENVVLVDGENIINLEDVNFSVASVIKAEKGSPPKPFGAFGPLSLEWPMIYWLLLAAVILLPTFMIYWKIRKTIKHKKLIESLEQYNVAIEPYNKFNKELRYIHKELQKNDSNDGEDKIKKYLSECERSFRLYMIREFKIPAFEWSDRQIINELIKKNKGLDKKVSKKISRESRLVFSEFTKAKALDKTSFVEVQSLEKLCQKVVTTIWRERKKVEKTSEVNR